MSSSDLTPAESVGHRRLKDDQPGVFRRTVGQGRVAEITNRRQAEAYLVPASTFHAMRAAVERAEEARALTTLIVAAMQAKVPIPSEALEALGPDVLDWEALNRFQAHFPVVISRGEDGEALSRADVPIEASRVAEDDEELELVG